MKNKKHIDELFKERFKNHETTPPPHVWDNIQAELQEKKKDRKVIPLWWKLGGVAALLALLFTIGNSVFNNEETNNKVVTEEKTAPIPTDSETKAEETIYNDSQVASETGEKSTEKTIDDDQKQHSDTNKASNNSLNSEENNKSAVAVENTPEGKIKNPVHKTTSEKEDNRAKQRNVITENDVTAIASETKNSDSKEVSEKNNSEKTNDLIRKESSISEEINSETAISETEKEIKKETEKKSIFDEIEDTKKAEEAVATTNKPQNRWDVAPNVAPVYYSSLNGGSSIDPVFADNSQSGDVNISYGVQVAYNITDRLSIRSGVNNVNLGYATGGVDIGTGPVAFGLSTINYNGNENIIIPADKGALNMATPGGDGFGTITPKSTGGSAQIIQDISYYEVPLELKYALLNNRFGINMIGGVSTLFLGNNEISVKDGNFRSVLGEANNLNSLSFTTNVGVGFDYKISKRLKFNVEPMFKYQLNPYTDSSVGFKPYYIGLYSGLSFKF
ncbi:porin family protein [Marixanthomonas ophiurae]|uniref:PorT family protein n=1 Tax=Marixanthomonas ophiurae TaxID=387659 RepID=A0A3E1QAE6_9FLAO|nr:outer membrane beta-barrel protein [Marixanthomonas ophiurae]RFN59097.1 PorT family protein [Marixanthomonas ophiurae]